MAIGVSKGKQSGATKKRKILQRARPVSRISLQCDIDAVIILALLSAHGPVEMKTLLRLLTLLGEAARKRNPDYIFRIGSLRMVEFMRILEGRSQIEITPEIEPSYGITRWGQQYLNSWQDELRRFTGGVDLRMSKRRIDKDER